MRRIFASILCLFLNHEAFAAIALIHKNGSAGGGASPYTQTITGTTAGNSIICAVEIVDNTKAISSVISNAASGNKTFSPDAGSTATNSTQTQLVEIWHLFNAGAATSITVTATATIGALFCFEYSGMGSTTETSGAANNLAVAATLTGPSMTTTVSGDVIVAIAADSNDCTSATAPYATDFITDATSGHCASDHIISGTVSGEQAVFHDSSTGGGCVGAAAFEPPGSSGPTVSTILVVPGTGRIISPGGGNGTVLVP